MGPLGLSSITLGIASYNKLSPSFGLDFLTGSLDPSLTFTRASIGTYTDSSGIMQTASANVPRFDYDPVTLECRGLLIEEARTNLLINSRGVTTVTGGTAVLTGVGSDGAANVASVMTCSAVNSAHFLPTGGITTVVGTVYTSTARVKAGTVSRCQVTTSSTVAGATIYANFQLTGAGAVLAVGAGTAAFIKPAPGGYYDCSISYTASGVGGGAGVVVGFISSDTEARLVTWTAAGTETLTVDHCQAEAGAFPTSIIPTNGATVTRAAESVSMIGTAFSSWFSNLAGTYDIDFSQPVTTGVSARLINSQNAGATELIDISIATSRQVQIKSTTGGATSFNPTTSGTFTQNGVEAKVAASWKAGNKLICLNAGTVVSEGTNIPSSGIDRAFFGSVGGSSGFLNGHIRRFTYYPVALTAAQLQAITT